MKKVAVITGGASGIGFAIAVKFVKNGIRVELVGRDQTKLKLACETLGELAGYTGTDLANLETVPAIVRSITAKYGRIDILVNNAGLSRGLDKIHEGKKEDWDEMIDTNIKGMAYVTRHVLPFMIKRKKGQIINIGSTAGHDVYPAGNVYAATKFAVKALSQSTRYDVLDKGIKVTSVDPGMVETEFSLVRFRGDNERAKKVYTGINPLSPKDVAETVLFCATRSQNVNINQVILTPLAQASSIQIIRKEK